MTEEQKEYLQKTIEQEEQYIREYRENWHRIGNYE
jgi:hypothetical protein